ncbi:hypothetical protein OG981_53795 [Streptomyces mirabilis]|uniref:hypothetical protein n=1 Tax=Streptomyces mirabilis TaxID=68239 RepID=UPI002E23B4DE
MLAAVRRLQPAGPSAPRTAPVLEPVKATTVLDAEDLAEVAAARGPASAAAALAAAEDVGADGYAMVLHRLIAADPAAWTADVPAVSAALQLPELGAFYLAAAAVLADRPGALPDGALAAAVTAVLDVRRRLDETAPAASAAAVENRSAAVSFADQALFDLITTVWRTGTALPGDQEKTILARLHAQAPLASPAAVPAPDTPARQTAGERTRRCWARIPPCGRWEACSSTPSTRPTRKERCPPTSSRRCPARSPRAGTRTR